MKFCTKCGFQIEETTRFCPKCGQQIINENSTMETNASQGIDASTIDIQSVENVPSKPISINLSKTHKIIISVLALVLILCFSLYKTGEALNSRDKFISKLTEAINTNNSSQLAKCIVSSDPKLKIDSKNLDGFLNYLNNNASYKKEIIKSLNTQAAAMVLSENTKESSTNSISNKKTIASSNYLLTLKKQGKTLLFYDKYVAELKPVYINVTTNYKNTQIFLGNNLVCTSDQNNFTKQIGPYVPGLYKMRAYLKGDYTTLDKTINVDLLQAIDTSNPTQNIKNQDLNLDGYNVYVTCDYNDAKLFANGKDTGLTIKEATNFGPVSKDGSVKLYAQKDFPWGTVKSEEITINGTNSIYIELNGINQDVKNTLMEIINDYNKSFIEGFKARDVSKIINMSENEKKVLSDRIQQMISNKQMYTGSLTKTSFDLDSFKIYQSNNKYCANVIDFETYNGSYYYEGSTPQTSISNFGWTYTLIYDELSKKWLVDNIYRNYYFNPVNKKDFTF